MDSEEKVPFRDEISFYMYKLKQIKDNTFEIEYIIPAYISYWLAEITFIENWTYEVIVRETDKAYLFEGKNSKEEDKWIAKSQLGIRDRIGEDDDHYKAHRSLISEKESNNNIIIV